MPGEKERRRDELLAESKTDADVARKVAKALARVEKYGGNWVPLDRKEVFEKYAPSAVPANDGIKIRYHEPGRTIDIVYDPVGDYFRLEDISAKTADARFLMADGTPPPHNVRKPNGHERGLTLEERKQLTHFKFK